MSKRKKILIIGSSPYNDNKGVSALSYSIIYILNLLEKKNHSHFDLFLVNGESKNMPKKDKITILSTSIKFTNIFPVNFIGIKNIIKQLAKLILRKGTFFSIKSYLKADYILDIGEGDSFSDIYGTERFRLIDDQHRMAKLLRKKQLFLPQTIGPFFNKKIEKQAIKSIEKADVVLSRDTQSYNFVKNNTTQKTYNEIIDIAFFLPYKKQSFDHNYINVGLNISSLLWHGGYTMNNQFGLKADFRKLIKEIVNYFTSIPKVKLHIIPHVVSTKNHVENDYVISYQLWTELNNENIVLAPLFLTPVDAKNYISGLDFFVGSRMHATIAAFSSNIPVFPLAYSRKFNGLFCDTLNYRFMGDLTSQTNEELLSDLKNAFENKEELNDIIQDRINTIVIEKEKLLKNYLMNFFE